MQCTLSMGNFEVQWAFGLRPTDVYYTSSIYYMNVVSSLLHHYCHSTYYDNPHDHYHHYHQYHCNHTSCDSVISCGRATICSRRSVLRIAA